MQSKIRVMRVTYPDIRATQWEGRKLRGFFAGGGGEGSLLHNHGEEGRDIYRYPLVQYKVIRQVPTIIAAEEGIRELHPLVMERQTLQIGSKSYPCGNMDLALSANLIGDCKEPVQYRFVSPWFALNQNNYRQYLAADPQERKALLERILVGNLLSLAKGFGITVEVPLQADCQLREQSLRFKEEEIVGFTGSFSVNFLIPELFGLGKSVSRGFGAVCRKKTPPTDKKM